MDSHNVKMALAAFNLACDIADAAIAVVEGFYGAAATQDSIFELSPTIPAEVVGRKIAAIHLRNLARQHLIDVRRAERAAQ